MVKAILQIAMLLLTLLAERGKSEPARKEKAERERFKKLISKKKPSKDELNDASALVWELVKRVSRAKGRDTS